MEKQMKEMLNEMSIAVSVSLCLCGSSMVL
jgi:hypothetical protein